MSPAIKYTLGRIGLFLLVFAVLFPTPLNILVKAMIAFVASAAFAFFLLRNWRDQMAEHLADAAARRSAEKARLRSALAGDDLAAEAGDRVAAADAKKPADAQRPADAKEPVTVTQKSVTGAQKPVTPAADAKNQVTPDAAEGRVATDAGVTGKTGTEVEGATAAGAADTADAVKTEHKTDAGK
ncbi:DUF4229 domain-containing protein [Actinoplanes sp. NPDC020271]|uniref:DUF4229 domain-containing protein n=1 Tax=Actinoplanes sp. NPDC020271 TaxID=3363896 RepID=UPI00379EC3D5